MAKKAKPSVDKIVKKVNKELEKTSAQIEGLISDALQQFDHLQHQIQDPVRKLLKDMDELRDREMKRFNEELERRMNEFHELQATLLERVGIASKEGRTAPHETARQAKAPPTAATGRRPAAKKAPAKMPATKQPAPPKAATPADRSALTRVKGSGPATARKMKEAGISSIEQP